jgi:riboflavin kinase/FMN adenylyltransferase
MASRTIAWQELPPTECRAGALAIGNFDGMHLGHAALLTALRDQARAVAGPAVALTFDPHPVSLLRPGQSPPLLTTTEDRCHLLPELGAEEVVVLRTTPDLLALTAEAFFARVIQERFAARALVEGVNFGFGRNRQGNVDTLKRLCAAAGLPLIVVPPVLIDGAEVSSSRIRAALLRGAVDEAARLLGRPYRLQGSVGTGQRRGQALGFPTANLGSIQTLIPGDGVYAVRVTARGTVWPGAANIGPNPTFGESAHKVEVHLLGFHGDLYGRSLAVDFLRRLRDTRPFAGVAELVAQLHRDIEQARQVFEDRG